MKEFRYKVVNPTQNVFLQDIQIRMFPGQLYNLDVRFDGDAQAKSGELRDAMRMNWIHRVPHEPSKVKKVALPKPIPSEPTDAVIKAGKVFDTAIDLGVFKTTSKGKLQIPSMSGKGKTHFTDQTNAVKRISANPELLKHLQTLCQG